MITIEQMPPILERLEVAVDRIEEALHSAMVIAEIPQPINADEAAYFLGRSRSTIYKMVNRNILPYYKKESRLYFFKEDLFAWVKSKKQKMVSE